MVVRDTVFIVVLIAASAGIGARSHHHFIAVSSNHLSPQLFSLVFIENIFVDVVLERRAGSHFDPVGTLPCIYHLVVTKEFGEEFLIERAP